MVRTRTDRRNKKKEIPPRPAGQNHLGASHSGGAPGQGIGAQQANESALTGQSVSAGGFQAEFTARSHAKSQKCRGKKGLPRK
jgi:hypothetical protein